jgi:excisionase family DNA binding protein
MKPTLTNRSPRGLDLLDVNEAADLLNVRPRFIRRLIEERRIRFYKVGRYNRVDRNDLIRFAEDGVVDTPNTRP